MTNPTHERWQRLMDLLEPIHGQALATACRLCRSASEGEDLYHDALLRAFDHLDTLRDESRFRSWFYALLLNRHRNRARGSFWKRFLHLEAAFPNGREPVDTHHQGATQRSESAARIARALARLAPEQREAVVLFEVDGFPIEEIAALQRASIAAVKSRLVRGREALRRHYARDSVKSAGAAVLAFELSPGLLHTPVPTKEATDD